MENVQVVSSRQPIPTQRLRQLWPAAEPQEARAIFSPLVSVSGPPFRGGTGPVRPNPAFIELEALLLRSFVGSMMPEESDSLNGQGLAGQYWEEMLSGEIASVLAQTGKLGVASLLQGKMRIEPAT